MASLRFPSLAARLLALGLLAGCAPARPSLLGATPQGEVQCVASVRREPGKSLKTVSGIIVEKCPQAGCWFDLRDDSGTLRVSTKDAGFTVLDVPLGTRVRVAGRLTGSGPDASLNATGVQY